MRGGVVPMLWACSAAINSLYIYFSHVYVFIFLVYFVILWGAE
jgi:hypothetical protein